MCTSCRAGQRLAGTAKTFVTAIRNQTDTRASATALYQQVLKPLAPDTSSSIVVIPDGSLHLVPFSALMDEHGAYVDSHLTISAAPSATVYYTLRTAAKRAVPSKPFLGVAYSATETGQPVATRREMANLSGGQPETSSVRPGRKSVRRRKLWGRGASHWMAVDPLRQR